MERYYEKTKNFILTVCKKHRKKIWIFLGFFLAFPALLIDMGKPATSRCAFVTILMGIFFFYFLIVSLYYLSIEFYFIDFFWLRSLTWLVIIDFIIGFYWMTEPIPLAATAFFPLLFFVCFGLIYGCKSTGKFNSSIFLH